MLALVHKNIVV